LLKGKPSLKKDSKKTWGAENKGRSLSSHFRGRGMMGSEPGKRRLETLWTEKGAADFRKQKRGRETLSRKPHLTKRGRERGFKKLIGNDVIGKRSKHPTQGGYYFGKRKGELVSK